MTVAEARTEAEEDRYFALQRLAAILAAPPPRLAALIVSLVILGLGLNSLRTWGFTTDDAYITLRFARNWVEGHGLVFNPGGARIEGYSNPLVLFVAAAALKVGADPILVIKVLSGGAFLAMLAATCLLGRRLGAGMWTSLAGVVIAGLFTGMVYWTYSGLETVIYVALVAWGACLILKPDAGVAHGIGAGVLLGLAAWTRIEGGLYAALAVAGCLVGAIRSGRLTPHLWCAVPVAVAGGGLLTFRLLYYGRILPNTYYCKSSGMSWEVVGEFVGTAWPLILMVFVRRPSAWGWRPLALVGACVIHVLLYRNASHLVAHHCRHFLVLLPLLCALAADSMERLPRLLRVLCVEMTVLVLVVMTVVLSPWSREVRDYEVRTKGRMEVARFLNEHADPNDQVFVADIGVIGYYCPLAVVDSLCLVDEYYAPCFGNDESGFIAHAMSERRPRWLVLQSSQERRLTATRSDILSIAASPEYAHYRLRHVVHTGTFGYYHILERPEGARPYEPVGDGVTKRGCPRKPTGQDSN